MNTTKCAIYIRVSTDEQAKEGYSLEAQEERLRSVAKTQGWSIIKIYKDDGISAKNTNRPALQELLYDAKLKKFDVLLIYKIDRLSRKLKDLIELVLLLNSYDIGVKSATETIDTTTPSGRLIFHQFGSFAQYERELIGERTKFGLMKRLKQGYWNTIPPYGYKLVNKKLTIDKIEGKMVKIIFDLYVSKNMGVVNISKELLLLKFKPRQSKRGKWKATTIHNILTNVIYIGKVRWGGDEAEGNHKPLISKETFEFVQAKLSQKRTWTHRYESPNHFLGIVNCGKCKSPMHIQYPGSAKKRKFKYYVCSRRLSFRDCDQEYIRADLLEKSIISEIKNLSLHKKEIFSIVNEFKASLVKKLKTLDEKKAETARELETLESENAKLYEWLMKHKPTDDNKSYLNQKNEDLLSRETSLKQKLWNIDDQVNEIKTKNINAEIITENLDRFVKTYDGLEPGEKKLLIESIVKEASIRNKTDVHLTLQIPFEKLGGVFMPECVSTGINNRNNLFLTLEYDLLPYLKSGNRKAILSAPYSKKKVII